MIKYWKELCIAILIVALLICYKGCLNTKDDLDSKNSLLAAQSDTITYYHNKDGSTTAETQASEITKETLKGLSRQNEQLKNELKKFKDVKSITHIETVFKTDTLVRIFHDSIPCSFDPISFVFDSTNYFISGKLTNKSISLNEVSFANKQTIIIGDKRTGMFSKPKYVVSVTNSNQLMSVTNLSNMTIVPERKWYDSVWLHIGIGLVTGIAITKL